MTGVRVWPAATHRVRRGLVGGVVVALAVATSACGLLSSGDSRDLEGAIVVTDMGIRAIGDPCSGRRPFLDLRAGAAVVVSDGDGTVLGEGAVGDSEALNAHPDLDHLDRTLTFCRLEFSVPDVELVEAGESYELEFGDGRTATIDPPDPDADDWFVEIAIPQ